MTEESSGKIHRLEQQLQDLRDDVDALKAAQTWLPAKNALGWFIATVVLCGAAAFFIKIHMHFGHPS